MLNETPLRRDLAAASSSKRGRLAPCLRLGATTEPPRGGGRAKQVVTNTHIVRRLMA